MNKVYDFRVAIGAGTALLEEVKRLDRIEWLCHAFAFLCALVAVFSAELPQSSSRSTIFIVTGVLGTICEAVASLLRKRAERVFASGRRMRRAAIILHGFGIPWQTDAEEDRKALEGKRVEVGVSVEQYYASTREPGWLKVVDDVHESSFFSAQLYQASSRFTTVAILAFFAEALAVSYVVITHHSSLSGIALACQIALAVVTFGTGSGLLDRSIRWRHAARECESIVTRGDALRRTADDTAAAFLFDTTLLYADYAAVTAGVPYPPTFIYVDRRELMTQKYAKRINQ